LQRDQNCKLIGQMRGTKIVRVRIRTRARRGICIGRCLGVLLLDMVAFTGVGGLFALYTPHLKASSVLLGLAYLGI